jgi:hypothetical protein
MSSGGSISAKRGSRRRNRNGTRALEPRSRSGRVSDARRRRARMPQRRAASPLPHPRLGWYIGVSVMAIVEIIEWPLALMMMLGHEIAHRAHTRALRDFAEGVEAGA